MSWSKHCSRLAPVWEELADKYNNLQESAVRAAVRHTASSNSRSVQVVIGKTDCLLERGFCSAEKVTGVLYCTVLYCTKL